MTIKPFDFEKLPRYSREEARMRAVLLEAGEGALCRGAAAAFSALAQKYLGSRLGIRCTEISSFQGLAARAESVPQPVVISFDLIDRDTKIYAAFPLLWVKQVVDRLLGGKGDVPRQLLPLSEIETGVFEFFILRGLEEYAAVGDASEALPPVFYTGILSPSAVEAWQRESGEGGCWVELATRATKKATYGVRFGLFFELDPWRRAIAASLAPRDRDEGRRAARQLAVSGHLEGRLSAEVGRVSLSLADSKRLEAGDVLLLDQRVAELKSGELAGMVNLRFDLLPAWMGQARIQLKDGESRSPLYELAVERL